jgi:hypothetical protein
VGIVDEYFRPGGAGKGNGAAGAGSDGSDWLESIVAHIVACTGCTPQQAWSEWDIPSIIAQNEYWRLHPPIHLLIAAQIGYKAPDAEESKEMTPEDLMQLFPMPT